MRLKESIVECDLDRVIASLLESPATPAGTVIGHTASELRQMHGLSERRLKQVLQAAKDKGILTVGKRPSTDLAGRSCQIPTYMLQGVNDVQRTRR